MLEPIWTKTFGGSGGDGGNSVRQTSDGGFIIVGASNSFGTDNNDIWLIKTDVNTMICFGQKLLEEIAMIMVSPFKKSYAVHTS